MFQSIKCFFGFHEGVSNGEIITHFVDENKVRDIKIFNKVMICSECLNTYLELKGYNLNGKIRMVEISDQIIEQLKAKQL